MNARPTVLAAVVVVVVGVATGAAIGGKTETRTRTVTVAGSPDSSGAVTSPLPLTSTDSEQSNPGLEPSRTAPAPNPDFKPEMLDDGLVTVDDTTRSALDIDARSVTLINVQYGVPAQLQQGPERDDGMRFDFGSSEYNEYAADYYQFEITVPEGATTFVSEMGFLKGEASGNRVKVAFYKNEYEEGKQLEQHQLDSASETASVQLVVRRLSKIIVRLTCKNQDRSWKTPDDDDPSFGFVDAHFE